ncbi:MAG: hypothetical protein LBR38_04345 [Synergistaceae bacterium]|jgi:hypothetical protein|nr:hypothetical protein [Synergistaceae bacterium]
MALVKGKLAHMTGRAAVVSNTNAEAGRMDYGTVKTLLSLSAAGRHDEFWRCATTGGGR